MDDIFREIRDNSIREAYFNALKNLRKSMPYISTEEIIQEVMKKEAPRFFITYDNARRVISLMHRGKPIRVSNENKLCMYKELYARFLKYKQEMKAPGYCVLKYIIEQPAPSYYVAIDTMRGIIYKSIKNR